MEKEKKQSETDRSEVGMDCNPHPAVAAGPKFFKYEPLPPHLQEVSRPFSELAEKIASRSSSAETTVALRKHAVHQDQNQQGLHRPEFAH